MCSISLCIECHDIFSNTTQLNKHAKDSSHKSHGYICGAQFSRLDALKRHVNAKLRNTASYPCEYCKRHQGANGFHRLDHLVQHLKGFHKFDVEDKLPKKRTGGLSITASSSAAFIPGGATLTGAGNSSLVSMPQVPPFPCTVTGCIKGGANGYVREVDLLEHQSMMHSFMVQGDMQFHQQDGFFQFQF
ncbi:uncharacterized protein F4812DRAFT_164239 [Daldinia caldariorum]|uniref:uncharacterized protein n=1 Tax=Daldinia caldariorum TaxID=326644 RepID=UPI002008DFFC|nr:uncharacterized protein F4812DRAFT_164239 [Daldinia caldariorum]KAI1471031.1 hypothetical protein F4812DRAFT_164239 [Daldinia caldariorum]